MKNIIISIKFTTSKHGNPLEWDIFCSKINEVINTGKGENIDVYINPPMARENIEYWVRSIEKMIKSTHFCEVHYFANNTVFGSGLYSNEIKEITYYFSFFIE